MSASETGTDRAARLRRAIAAKRAGAGPRAATLDARPAGEPAWLGELQRGLWFVHQLDPSSSAYNLASAFRVHGPLDLAALERALQAVVDRHRLLRSTFRAEDGEPMQVIHQHLPVTVKRIVAGLREGEAQAAREAARPFDLARGPLLRASLVEETPGGDRLLILVLHHLLADERSLEFLWQQIAERYAGGSPGSSVSLPQYDDYAHWLRQAGPDGHDSLAYWKRQLDPLPDVLRLPFERPVAGRPVGTPGRLLQRTLDPAAGGSLRPLASSLGVTPFVVGAFAFRLLLDRYTAGQRIAFGTPVSTRSHPSTAEMIGYFLNALPICATIDESLSVREAIVRFNATVTAGLAHGATPFDVLAAELSPRRDIGRHPVFQAMFVYQESGPPPALGEARLEPVTLDLGASKFDLTVFALEQPAAWRIGLEYRTDRFDAVWMERLLDHYERLLDQLPRQVDQRLADVPMLTEDEVARLSGWERGPALDVELPPSIPSQVLEHAAAHPDSPAVVCGDRTQRYADLASAARAIGGALVAGGVAPGDRVAVFCDRGLPMVGALVGSQLSGAGYVPLDPAYPQARTLDVLRDADVSAVVTTAALRDRLPQGSWTTVLADMASADEVTAAALPDLSPALPAYVLYTSGSTGRPKGVVVTHDNLRRSTLARRQVYASPPERFLLLPSIAFDSSVAGLFWTLAAGGTLVVPTDEEARDARHLADLVERQSVTTLLCVPSLYAQLLRAHATKLAALRTVIVAGESCPSALVEEHFAALPRVRLFNEYGPTEATVWASVHEMTPADAVRPVPIGRPIPGVRVEVRDRRGRQTPAGVPGDGWIAGPTVASGYWRRDDLTAARFSGSGDERRYRTGDRLVWTADGTLLFLGRDDEQLKLRGYRIEPGEIEAALREFVKVEEAAVVLRGAGRAGPPGDEDSAAQLVAFVTTPEAFALDEWRAALADRLPAHLIPARLVRLDALPRLPNGKVDRQALQQVPLEAPPAEPAEDLTSREQALRSLWEGLLGRTGIRATDNFFELGGHSLLVMQMVAAIEREFDVTLAAADVFQHPTVRELAHRIDERGEHVRRYEQLFPIQTGGRRAPFIMVVPDFFTEALAKRFRGERPVYGVRGVSVRTDGNRGRWPTMRHLAGEIADEIERRFPGRACVLAGYSFGAWVAIEIARVLEQRQVPVQHLYAIAPMPVDVYRVGPFRIRVDGLRQPLADLGLVEVCRHYLRASDPFTRGPYRRARQWLFERPWRRLLARLGARRLRRGLPMTTRQAQADVRVERFRLHASYRPGIVHAPTTIFNPAGLATDSAATWRPFFRGPLTVHAIPDPHDEASVSAAREQVLDRLRDLGD